MDRLSRKVEVAQADEMVYLAKKELAQALAEDKRASGEVTCRVFSVFC